MKPIHVSGIIWDITVQDDPINSYPSEVNIQVDDDYTEVTEELCDLISDFLEEIHGHCVQNFVIDF